MTLELFIDKLRSTPEQLVFEDTMNVIETICEFSPTAFKNGTLYNEAGQNSGSCKLFAFAVKQGLTKEETLACFGQYYADVLNNPSGEGHQNIRNFMNTGFDGLEFDGEVLEGK